MGVTTPDIVWEALDNLHDTLGLSFRAISQIRPFNDIPPGTLNTMWKHQDMPYKWAARFGILAEETVKVCPVHRVVHKFDCEEQRVIKKRVSKYKDLWAMPDNVLKWKLENREELT